MGHLQNPPNNSPLPAEFSPPAPQPSYPTPTLPTRLLFLPFPPEGPATTSVAEREEEAPREDIAATILYSVS